MYIHMRVYMDFYFAEGVQISKRVTQDAITRVAQRHRMERFADSNVSNGA